MRYELLICPVCLEQVEPGGYEDVTGCYHQNYGGYVEPMTIPAHVMASDLSAAREGADPVLEKLLARETARREKQEAWEALPQAEKDRIKAEEWAAMTPEQKAFHNLTESLTESFRESLTRQLYGESPLLDRIGKIAKVPTGPQ